MQTSEGKNCRKRSVVSGNGQRYEGTGCGRIYYSIPFSMERRGNILQNRHWIIPMPVLFGGVIWWSVCASVGALFLLNLRGGIWRLPFVLEFSNQRQNHDNEQ